LKLGIMQPYFFPYIGYFQLIGSVDQFVIHDDVQWIKGGWVNRNRILLNAQPHYITLPLKKDSSLLNINERELSLDTESKKNKIIRQIEGAYGRAPYFESVFTLVSTCFTCKERNASSFIVNSLRKSCDYLGIKTPFVLSSDLDKRNELNAEERVIDINIVMGASHYINPAGGSYLYNKTHFLNKGLKLSFIKTKSLPYQQFNNHKFIPFLSIIDLMMFNSRQQISYILNEYNIY